MSEFIDRQALYDAIRSALNREPSVQLELNTSLYTDGFDDGYKQGWEDGQEELRREAWERERE